MSVPIKRYWMGQDLDDLSREKLIEIIDHLHWQVESTSSTLKMTFELHEAARKARARAA
jgi:hypothetical protein